MVNEMCCQVKFRDKNRDTVLHHAAYGGMLENVKCFIEKSRLDPNCKRDGKEKLQYLLHQRSVHYPCKDENGNTPLHSAAKNGDKRLCELLMAPHCTPYDCNYEGQDPASIAKQMGHEHLWENLEKVKKLHHGKF